MPTILQVEGFTFKVLTRDHDPPHVHVYAPEGTAKFMLGEDGSQPRVVMVIGLRRHQVLAMARLVVKHRAFFLEAWRRIHG